MTNVHLENRRVSRQLYLIIWIEYALIYMTKNCFNAAMASIVYEGVLTKSQTGLIIAAFHVVYGPLQIVGGLIADRFDPERLIKIGLICSGILNLLLFFFNSFWMMLVLWALNGLAQFAIWPSIVKIITSQLAPSERKNGAFYIAFASVGGLLVSYLIAACITRWEYNFLVSGVVLLVLAVIWVAECHNIDPYMVTDKTEETITSVDPVHSPKGIFLKSGFVLIVAFFFFRTMVDQAIKSFSPTMLMEIYSNVTPSIGNLLNVLIVGVNLLGAVGIRKLYPKYIHSEIIAVLLISVMCLPFCGLLLFSGKIALAVVVACLCVASCLLNSATVLINCANVHFAPYGKSATAAGVVNAAASLAFICVNYGIALLADLSGWIAVLLTMFVFLGISILLIAVVVPLWRKFTNLQG